MGERRLGGGGPGLQLSVRVGGEEGGKSEIKEEGVEKHERGGGRADLGLFTVGREKGDPGCWEQSEDCRDFGE